MNLSERVVKFLRLVEKSEELEKGSTLFVLGSSKSGYVGIVNGPPVLEWNSNPEFLINVSLFIHQGEKGGTLSASAGMEMFKLAVDIGKKDTSDALKSAKVSGLPVIEGQEAVLGGKQISGLLIDRLFDGVIPDIVPVGKDMEMTPVEGLEKKPAKVQIKPPIKEAPKKMKFPSPCGG